LTPSTLASIREYNDTYGYEINYNNLKVYGSSTVTPSCSNVSDGNCWDYDEKGTYITLNHYGSKFLEEFMEEQGAVYSGTLTSVSNMDLGSCFVENSSDVTYENLSSKVKSCRWVDYIQTNDKGQKFRLAFK